jgi:hypothetical protein
MRPYSAVAAVLGAAVSIGVVAQVPEQTLPLCEAGLLVEVGAQIGIDFIHETGATGDKHNPETMGSGLAWIDYDGDGWLDLYVVQSGPFPPQAGSGQQNVLFRNVEGQRFERVTAAAGAGDLGYGQGAVAADIDGDGLEDLYLTNYGDDRFLANRGDGTFEDRSVAAALTLDGWSSSAALADADRDGDLDLYVSRYVEHDPAEEPFCAHPATGEPWYCDPSVFVGRADAYFRNRGDGTFEEATAEAGFASATGKGLGVLFVDLNGDGWPDVYVANDMTINLLFENSGDGTFFDQSLISGTAVSREGMTEAGMGLALGDVDADGDPDLSVSNYDVQTNTLYMNLGDFQFEDVSASSGFGLPSFNFVGFGLALADFDGDGWLDAYVGNGHTTMDPARENVTYEQPDLLLMGDGTGRFSAGCVVPGQGYTVSRGLGTADFDNDGAVDVAVQRSAGPLALLRHEVSGAPWIGARLVGSGANSGAVGAVVRLDRQSRWIVAGDSYQSSSDRRVLFGLGSETQRADLDVRWPNGKRQRIVAPPVGRYLVLSEGEVEP